MHCTPCLCSNQCCLKLYVSLSQCNFAHILMHSTWMFMQGALALQAPPYKMQFDRHLHNPLSISLHFLSLGLLFRLVYPRLLHFTSKHLGILTSCFPFLSCPPVSLPSRPPIVLLSDDLIRDPEGMLRALCHALSIPFQQTMLSWPAGPKPFDGLWAPWWYANTHKSTGE